MVENTIKDVDPIDIGESPDLYTKYPPEYPSEFGRLVSAFDVLIRFVREYKVEVMIRMNGIAIILKPTEE